MKLPANVQGRVLVPGPVRLPAAAAAVSAAAGAAARRAALKKLKRKKDDWSDDSSEDDSPSGDKSAPAVSAALPLAARPEATWSTQHRFSKLNYWYAADPHPPRSQCIQLCVNMGTRSWFLQAARRAPIEQRPAAAVPAVDPRRSHRTRCPRWQTILLHPRFYYADSPKVVSK